MNMLLHGIPDADNRKEDTLRKPQHKAEGGELKRFDRILANPQFSQNHIRKDMEYPGRFQVWLPEKGKKADLMFVQHMLAVLKADGKIATVMPHGVLFHHLDHSDAFWNELDKIMPDFRERKDWLRKMARPWILRSLRLEPTDGLEPSTY